MTKLYKKSEITFAILWIIAYVILSSIADQLSESVGIKQSLTAAAPAAYTVAVSPAPFRPGFPKIFAANIKTKGNHEEKLCIHHIDHSISPDLLF